MTKKLLSLALVVIMVFAMAIPAFAAEEPMGTAMSEEISLKDLSKDQVTQLTKFIKSRAIVYSTIKFNLDRSVYYDPVITDVSANDEGTYDITVRSGFTFLFYYTAKIYKANDSDKIVDIRFIDADGAQHQTTQDIDNPDEMYRYDSLIQGLIAYLVNYIKSAVSDLFAGL